MSAIQNAIDKLWYYASMQSQTWDEEQAASIVALAATAELAAKDARIAELERALEPFAALQWHSDEEAEGIGFWSLSLDDLRRARAVLIR
jgi:cell division protein ZapA (FtsZ GTPase activity inhibitor)